MVINQESPTNQRRILLLDPFGGFSDLKTVEKSELDGSVQAWIFTKALVTSRIDNIQEANTKPVPLNPQICY